MGDHEVTGQQCVVCGTITMRILPKHEGYQNLYHTGIRCGRLDARSYVCDGPLKTILPKKLLKLLAEMLLEIQP